MTKRLTRIKILLVAAAAISIISFFAVSIWKYPFGVRRYKTIVLGMQSAEMPGDSTGWAPPDSIVPEKDFYVYSLGDENMCIGSDCGIGGYFVECLDGWISGYKDIGDVADYGLREVGVNIDKQKIITIADKNSKIVGIYPGASIKNLPYILRNHRNLFSKNAFNVCSNLLPRRLK